MDKLIETYLTERSVTLVEKALEKLVLKTNASNYLEVISKIENYPTSSEIDVAMYIHDIANPHFSELLNIINLKRLIFTDKEAIEELDFAMLKIQKNERRIS